MDISIASITESATLLNAQLSFLVRFLEIGMAQFDLYRTLC